MKHLLFLLFAAGLLKSNGQGVAGYEIVDKLPKSKLYIFAQEHNLETGQDTILSFINAEAPFKFMIASRLLVSPNSGIFLQLPERVI
jgi:hypothetical protein